MAQNLESQEPYGQRTGQLRVYFVRDPKGRLTQRGRVAVRANPTHGIPYRSQTFSNQDEFLVAYAAMKRVLFETDLEE